MIKKSQNNPLNRTSRSGSAAVEAALILPLLIIISIGAINVSQYINLAQLVSNASREGARVACRNGTQTVDQVELAIIDFMSDALAHLSPEELSAAVNIEVRDGINDSIIPSRDLTKIPSGGSISVHLAFDFSKVRWIPGPSYWNNDVQESKTICRRE